MFWYIRLNRQKKKVSSVRSPLEIFCLKRNNSIYFHFFKRIKNYREQKVISFFLYLVLVRTESSKWAHLNVFHDTMIKLLTFFCIVVAFKRNRKLMVFWHTNVLFVFENYNSMFIFRRNAGSVSLSCWRDDGRPNSNVLVTWWWSP